MRLVGIIPARAGSVRLPEKNIADLGGKPLLQWSIDVGLKTCSAGVYVSTDSAIIADVARARGASGVIMRPPELGADGVTTETVVRHACDPAWVANLGADAILVLQPTSPFRTEEDVQRAVEVMERNNADVVISVCAFLERDALFRLGWADRLRPAHTVQDMIYVPNGAIYLIRTAALHEDWYGAGTYAYRMPVERSLDIDTHSDMDAARVLLAK